MLVEELDRREARAVEDMVRGNLDHAGFLAASAVVRSVRAIRGYPLSRATDLNALTEDTDA